MHTKYKISNLLELSKNNKKIIENYFFMTILQILNSFFYLLIYPFLIRTLGLESYGLFIFITSINAYFLFIVNFGFEMPAIKAVAENVLDNKIIEKILSSIFTAKLYLFISSGLILSLLILLVPFFEQNKALMVIVFFQAFSVVFFPQWYFQAIQKMRVVTYIQLAFKIISLPFIFILIKSSSDLNLYALIVTLGGVVGGVVAFIIIQYNHKLKIKIVKFQELKIWLKDGFPFFLSNSAGIVKEQSVPLVIGTYFGMEDVAIYDLANKIIMIPRTIFLSINAAIFPKLINNIKKATVKKIINLEVFISLFVIVLIVVFGKFIVQLMGGITMLAAYPMAIFLSISVMTWLVVGAYISFVFIPNNKYYLVTKNQIIALVSFLIYVALGLFLFKNILVFGIAIALSGLTEIIYCKFVTKTHNML